MAAGKKKKQKPGPKKGTGQKGERFNMRCSASFRPKLAWLRSNEHCVYYEMTDSQILELMAENAVLICEVMGQRFTG